MGVSQKVTKSDGGEGGFGILSKPQVTSFMDGPLKDMKKGKVVEGSVLSSLLRKKRYPVISGKRIGGYGK